MDAKETAMSSAMLGRKMFFRETYEVLPGRTKEFLARYRTAYAPGMARLGLNLMGLWETSPIEGRDTAVIALWEMPDGAIQARLALALDSLDEGDAALQAARDELSVLIARRNGWCLLGVGEAMGIAEAKAAGIGLRTCLWSEVDIVPNQHALYDKSVRVNLLRLLEGSGIRLVGIYRPQLHSIEAVALWDLAQGAADLAWYDEIAQKPEFLHWNGIALTSRTAWRARLLEAA
jgi:hypothetical protein